MKEYSDFSRLVEVARELPETGWIFVKKSVDLNSEKSILAASFFLAESQLEEIDMEQKKRTFLECPTLVDIISVLDKRSVKPCCKDYLEAVIYYREHDDFQE